ncbi:MAG: Ig-like domain-containing protein, partial [Planctomycetota bacterium]
MIPDAELLEASHTITLIATDQFSNTSEPVEIAFAIDTTAPSIPPAPVLVDEEGSEVLTRTTSNTRLRIRAMGETDSIVRLFQDSHEVGLAIANTTVEFPVNLGSLGDGTFTFTATTEDTAGNRSTASEPLTVVIDTTPPDLNRIELDPASDTGTIGDQTTDLPSVKLVGSSEPDALVRIAGTTLTAITDADGNFLIDSVPLSFGPNVFSIFVTDELGNSHEESLTLFRPRLESNPPTIAVSLSDDTGQFFNDALTSSAAIRGAVSDDSGVSALFLSGSITSRSDAAVTTFGPLDITSFLEGDVFSLSTSDLEATLGRTLLDGQLDWSVIALDIYENVSSAATVSFELDATPPVAPQITLDPTSDLGASPSDGITSATNLALVLDVDEIGAAEVFIDGDSYATVQLAAGLNEVTLAELPAGTHVVTASTTDIAGNVSGQSEAFEVIVDTTPPTSLSTTITLAADGSDDATITGLTEPLATVFVFRGLDSETPIAEATADTSGDFEFGDLALANGLNRFRVAAQDIAGNDIETTVSTSYTAPDTSPPEVRLALLSDTGASEDDLLTREAAITGMVDDASRIAAFQVSVQSGPFVNTLGSLNDNAFTLSRSILETIAGQSLVDGSVSVRVRATDVLGQASEVTELNFTLDATRPETPHPLVLNPTDDSGAVGDGSTNVSTLRFETGSQDSDAEVVLFLDGQAVDRAPVADSMTLAASNVTGRHRFVAQSIDAAGNVSFFTAPRYITFDDQFIAPTIGLRADQRRDDLGSSLHTTDAIVSILGDVEPGARLQLQGRSEFAIADGFGRYEISDLELTPGDNSLTLIATDVAGNSSTSDFTIVFVDRSGPSLQLELANDTGRSSLDRRTFDPTISGTVNDPSGLRSLSASLNDFPAVDITGALIGEDLTLELADLESILGQSLPDGRFQLTVNAIDALANASSTTLEFDLDRSASPLSSAPDLLTSDDLGHDARDNVTATAAPTVRVFAERGALVKFYIDGTLSGELFSTGVAQYTLPTLLSGSYDITATVEDLAGNIAPTTEPLTLTVDREIPVAVTLEMFAFHQSGVRDNHTTDAQVNLIGTSEVGTRITMTGQSEAPVVDDSGLFFFVADLAVGTNEFVVSAEDVAGNAIEQTFVFTRGERLPPEFTLEAIDQSDVTPPILNGQLRSENTIVSALVSTAPDFALSLDLTDLLSNGEFTLTPSDIEAIHGAPFVDGTHTLYFQATDRDGRVSEPTSLDWRRDATRQAEVEVSVSPISSSFRYDVHATAASDPGQRLDQISIPVPADALVSEIVVPPTWRADHSSGDTLIRFIAEDPANGLTDGQSLSFRFTADTAPTLGKLTLVMTDLVQAVDREVSVGGSVPSAVDSVAVTDFYTTLASQNLSIDSVLGLRSNDALDASLVLASDTSTLWGASVTVAPDGGFELVADDRYIGVAAGETIRDSFTYTVRAADQSLHTGTAFITVEGENQPPVAVDDIPIATTPSLFTRADSTIVLKSNDLLGNDTDPDVNDRLSLAGVESTSALGATIMLVEGVWIYDPTGVASFTALAAGESRRDQVVYTIRDAGGLTVSATANIHVQSGVNVAPVAAGSSATLDEDGQLISVASLLDGATDSDSLPGETPLRVVPETIATTLGASVTLFADGSFEFDATGLNAIQSLAPGEDLNDSFEFRVTDGTEMSTPAVVSLAILGVNDAPLAIDDSYLGVAADDSLTVDAAQGLLANDTDIDSSSLIIDPSQTLATTQAGATISLRPDGSFDYEPGEAFVGLSAGETTLDSFTYVVHDELGAESAATATIQIVGVDDAPVAGTDGIERGFWTVASQTLSVTASEGVLANDFDPDTQSSGTRLEASFDGFSQFGARVVVAPDGGFTYDPTASTTLAQLQASGVDVVDRFTYTVSEVPEGSFSVLSASSAPQASSEGVVEIVLKSGPSNYSFDLVAGGFERVGSGVSINNYGNVAFSATESGKDNLFIWEESEGIKSLLPDEIVFGDASVTIPPRGEPTDSPSMRFSDTVQVNDGNQVHAQRQLNAEAAIGMFAVGVPVLEFTDVALTYSELWNAQRLYNAIEPPSNNAASDDTSTSEHADCGDEGDADSDSGSGDTGNNSDDASGDSGGSSGGTNGGGQDNYASPRQLAVGDEGLANAGLRWGDPLMLDMQLFISSAVLPPIFGTAATASRALVPRVWTTNPVWSSAFFTPANPVWNAFQHPDAVNLGVLQATALVTSIMPIFEPQIYVTPFTTVRPETASVNNRNEAVFIAETNDSETDPGLSLVTFSREREQPYVRVPLDQPVSNVQLSDTGWSVFLQGGQVKAMSINGDVKDLGLTAIGDQVAISDTGIIAAAAEGPSGRGIYAVDPETGQTVKVVGESGDGLVDPNEASIDGNDVGGIASLLAGPIGINGAFSTGTSDRGDVEDNSGENGGSSGNACDAILDPSTAAGLVGAVAPAQDPPSGTPFLTVTFMAADGDGSEGLHSARFYFPSDGDDVVPPELFLGHGKVVDIGEVLPGIGTVDGIEGFDVINNSGQIVFKTGDKVVRANPPVYATGEVLYALEGRSLSENQTFARDGGAAIATFVAGDPSASIDQFTATVDFGDGETETAVIRPGNGPLTFEVIADHSYHREGPYAITVHITDVKNRNGGVAVSLANIINVKSEESIERLALADDEGNSIMPTIESFATPVADSGDDPARGGASSAGSSASSEVRSFGLFTFASIDRASGTYEVVALGTAGFSYAFGFETAGSDGQGEPGASQRGDGSGINVRKVLARGSIDGVSFTTGAFSVDEYETAFDGEASFTVTTESSSFAENATTTSNIVSQFVDEKTWSAGTFDWTLTSDKQVRYSSFGERYVDGDLAGQVDALVAGGGSSLVGNFSRSGVETTLEVLREFGGLQVATRHLNLQSSSTSDHQGGRQRFSYVDRNRSTRTTESIGNVNRDGSYSITVTTASSATLEESSRRNGPLQTSTTGFQNATTTMEKSGNIQFGDYSISSTTTASAGQTTLETNQGQSSSASTETTSNSSLLGSGNDESGEFRFLISTSTVTSADSVLTNVIDRDYQVSSTQESALTTTISQSGNLYGGDYVYDEQGSQTQTSQTTTTNGPSTIVSDSTSSASTTRLTTGNKKTGSFQIISSSDSTGESTSVSTNQSLRTETNTLSVSESESEKSGDARAGTYVFSGYQFADAQTTAITTNTHVNGIVHREESQQQVVSESTYFGDGNSKTGALDKVDETRSDAHGSTTATNQTSHSTRVTETRTRGESATTSNTLTGIFSSVSEQVSFSTVATDTVNHDFRSQQRSEIDASQSSTTEGDRITGESITVSMARSQHATQGTHEIHTQTATSRINSESRTESTSSANAITGEYSTRASTVSQNTESSLDNNQTLVSHRVSTNRSSAQSQSTGNSITGDATENTESQSSSQSLAVTFNGPETTILSNERSYPFDTTSELGELASGLTLVLPAGLSVATDSETIAASAGSSSETSVTNSNGISGVYERELNRNASSETRTRRSNRTSDTQVHSTANSSSSATATGNSVTGDNGSTTDRSSVTETTSSTQNQGQTRTQSTSSSSTQVGASNGNEITGVFTTNHQADAEESSTSIVVNQTLETTTTKHSVISTQTTGTENQILGTTEATQATTSNFATTTETANQAFASIHTVMTESIGTITSSANANTGAFSEDRSAITTTTKETDSTNDVEAISGSESVTSNTSSASDGNSILGVYSSNETLEQTVESSITKVNQTLTSATDSNATSETTTVRRGNSVTGDYDESWETESSSTESQQNTNQSRQSTLTSDVDSSSVGSVIGNQISGALQRNLTDSSTAQRSETLTNATLSSTSSITITNEGTAAIIGNSIEGTANESTMYERVTVQTEQSTNGLEVGSVTIIDAVSGAAQSDSNSITGIYSETATTLSESSRSTVITNQTERTDGTATIQSQATVTETGNQITGGFRRIADSTTSGSTDETTTNQTQTFQVLGDESESLTDETLGNSITGERNGSMSSMSTSTLETHLVNQSLEVAATIIESVDRETVFSGNSIRGNTTSSTENEGTRTRSETLTNGTLEALADESTSFVSTSVRSENVLTGVYEESIVGSQASQILGTDQNKTLVVQYQVDESSRYENTNR